MNATEREQQLTRSWVSNAEAWTKAVREQKIESRKVGTDAAIIEAVRSLSPHKVLDVGCGEGWLARELSTRGIEVVGFDGSAPLIERANQLGGGSFLVLNYDEFVSSPSRACPPKSEGRRRAGGDYDTVVCNFALLTEDLVPSLKACASVLKSDGWLVIQTVHPFTACGEEPYRNGWRVETFSKMGKDFTEPMPWYFRTVASWIGQLNQSGFIVVECGEPVHPESGRPLSLVLMCRRSE